MIAHYSKICRAKDAEDYFCIPKFIFHVSSFLLQQRMGRSHWPPFLLLVIISVAFGLPQVWLNYLSLTQI